MDRWREVFGQDAAGSAGHEFRVSAQQIVNILPEPARDPKAVRFADAEVFPLVPSQPDTGERQQEHQRLVGRPTAMASIDPDGGHAFEELVGSHDDFWFSQVRPGSAFRSVGLW